MKSIEIDVYGQRLVLQGDADESYVQELARYVESQMQNVAQGLINHTPAKIAILAAINIANQLFQQEKCRLDGEAEVERRAQHLLQTIEGRLNLSNEVA